MSAEDQEKYLLELLAIIHRDGGHYVAEHGIDKAVAAAREIIICERAEIVLLNHAKNLAERRNYLN